MAGLLSDASERDKVMKILSDNSQKQFVQRILTPDKYPRLDLGGGDYATHKMAWGSVGEKGAERYVVFPTVMYDGKGLLDYGDEAFRKAMESGEYIEFNSPEEADWFSQRYKAAWGK